MDGMHELFHGLHGNQLRRKRNPLKQPARDRAQRRDAPLDRLSKDLHSMLHGTHDSPASLEPEKQVDVLGRLSAGMHGMLHGTHQKPAHRRSVSLRAARSPDRRPQHKSKAAMENRLRWTVSGPPTAQLSAGEDADDLAWGNEPIVGSSEPAAVSNDSSIASASTVSTDFALRSQPEAAEDATVRQASSELGEAERHEREPESEAAVAAGFPVAPAHEARIYDRGKSAISQYQWVCCREGEKRMGIARLAGEAVLPRCTSTDGRHGGPKILFAQSKRRGSRGGHSQKARKSSNRLTSFTATLQRLRKEAGTVCSRVWPSTPPSCVPRCALHAGRLL